MTRVLSLGGQTVAGSLALAGFAATPGVELVETADPRRRLDAVLVQSAWNVIGWPEFASLQRAYPTAMRSRAVARRLLSRYNLKRARTVVCLTEAVAVEAERFAHRDVVVSPVALPFDAPSPVASEANRLVVVPGTVTWYKRPRLALDWAAAHREAFDAVVFLGPDDGSGCREDLARHAAQAEIPVRFEVVGREAFYDHLAPAGAVVLPSRLESLGFALAEALWVNPRVVASAIPAHREVAVRLGRSPSAWLDRTPTGLAASPRELEDLRADWVRLGDTLGLARN